MLCQSKASRLLLSIGVLCAPSLAISQSVSSNSWTTPAGWIHAPGSKENPTLWECAGRGGSWSAVLRKGEVALVPEDSEEARSARVIHLPPSIHLEKEMMGRHVFVDTGTGYLVGFDAGEFGGGLWWFGHNGKVISKIFSENVHAIYKTSKGIFVLAGLNHLDSDGGKLFRFEQTPDEVSATEIANLHGAPEASEVLSDGRFLIATPKSVLRVDANGKVETLYQGRRMLVDHDGRVNYINDERDWFIYPESVVSDQHGDVYVGMRFFVVRIRERQGTFESEWLMPDKCQKFKTVRYICSCNGSRP